MEPSSYPNDPTSDSSTTLKEKANEYEVLLNKFKQAVKNGKGDGPIKDQLLKLYKDALAAS